jgi:hypothetical protein
MSVRTLRFDGPLDLSAEVASVLDELQLHLRQILTEYAQHYNEH